MNQGELEKLAEAWIEYYREGATLPARESAGWSTDAEYELRYEDPEGLWKLILEIHRRDHSTHIRKILSAGPIEDLLSLYGERFIDRVELEAKSDPLFARVLGGVWRGDMTQDMWDRLQAVWDRRGWDGIPE